MPETWMTAKLMSASANVTAMLAVAEPRNGIIPSRLVTSTKKKVVAYEAARMATAWNSARRDENIEYYVAKLTELSAKFEAFAPRPGAPAAPASTQTSLEL